MVYGKCIGTSIVLKLVYLGEGELFSCKCIHAVIIEMNLKKKHLGGGDSLSAVLKMLEIIK